MQPIHDGAKTAQESLRIERDNIERECEAAIEAGKEARTELIEAQTQRDDNRGMLDKANQAIKGLAAEIDRLKELACARPIEEGKSVRVEMKITAAGMPYLIVTAPAYFEEERLAETIAGIMNLWVSVAEELAARKRAGNSGEAA